MPSDQYTESYGDLNVHLAMLQDSTRMNTYFASIEALREYFEGSCVMDVGCGIGILSMWIAKYTKAKKIIAVEANYAIAGIAETLIARNDLSDRIVVIKAKVEDLVTYSFDDREFDKVDIIISEWMGHYLLHESMLDSVLVARDNFLRSGHNHELPDLVSWRSGVTAGLILPSRVNLYYSFCEITSPDLLQIPPENLYGIDVSLLADIVLLEKKVDLNLVHITEKKSILQPPRKIVALNLVDKNIVLNDFEVTHSTNWIPSEKKNCRVGLCLWFDCVFTTPAGFHILKTGPGESKTHWKQTVIDLGIMNVTRDVKYALRILRESSEDKSYLISFHVLN